MSHTKRNNLALFAARVDDVGAEKILVYVDEGTREEQVVPFAGAAEALRYYDSVAAPGRDVTVHDELGAAIWPPSLW
jgi:hypothetical protein